jgi:hypothetical protein
MGRRRMAIDAAAIRALAAEGDLLSRGERAKQSLTRRGIGRRFGISESLVTLIVQGSRHDVAYRGHYNKKETVERAHLAHSPTCQGCGQTKQFETDVNGVPFEWCGNTRCALYESVPPVRDIFLERLKLMIERTKKETATT